MRVISGRRWLPSSIADPAAARTAMTKLDICYVGSAAPGSTSLQRANALRRLGHRVSHYDPSSFLNVRQAAVFARHRTGFRFVDSKVRRHLPRIIGEQRFDVAWVGGGREIGPETVEYLRGRAKTVVNYNNDDPTGGSEGRAWDLYLRALSAYDLVVVMREPNVEESRAWGARDVMRVYMSFDEVEHAPVDLSERERESWASDVCFIGVWRPERGPIVAGLLDAGVPLSIWGDRWERAREWPQIRSVWRGPSVMGADYAAAIQCAKLGLGLLSKGNRDEHTQRSMEIPALGTVLCAERTPEHSDLYRDGKEAVLWSNSEECAQVAAQLLENDARRADIARHGHERVVSSRVGNEPTMARILERALHVSGST